MKPHKFETPSGAGVQVSTSEFALDAGVDVRVNLYQSDRDESHVFSTSFSSFTFNLTPDEADNLAAILVAHAYDRRQQEAALAESAAPPQTYYKAPTPRTIWTAGPTYAAPPLTEAEKAAREAVEA